MPADKIMLTGPEYKLLCVIVDGGVGSKGIPYAAIGDMGAAESLRRQYLVTQEERVLKKPNWLGFGGETAPYAVPRGNRPKEIVDHVRAHPDVQHEDGSVVFYLR